MPFNPGSFFNVHNPGTSNYSLDPYQGFEHDWAAYAGMSPYSYNIIDDIQNPFLRQYIEWSQQMTSQMYQNHWNSEQEQMKRAIEAGINPYLAANGIAGSSTQSAASVPSSAVGQGAETLKSVAHGIGTAFSSGSAVVGMLDTILSFQDRSDKTKSETRKNLADAGFSEAGIVGLEIDNKYKDENWVAELNIKRQQFSNMQADYALVKTQKDFVQKQLDRYDEMIKSTLDLQEAQKLAAEKQKFYIDEQTKAIQLENEFTRKYWSHMDSPADVAFKNLYLKALDSDDPNMIIQAEQAYFAYIRERNYNENYGTQQGVFDWTYKIASEQFKAEEAFKRAGNVVELGQRLFDTLGITLNRQGIKAFRETLSNSINALYDRIEKADTEEERDKLYNEIRNLQFLMSLSNRELKRYLSHE